MVWVKVGEGQASEVRCRPDINVDNLKTAIKEKFKPQLDTWSPAQLTLKFNGTTLEPEDLISEVIPEDKDGKGKVIPVIVEVL